MVVIVHLLPVILTGGWNSRYPLFRLIRTQQYLYVHLMLRGWRLIVTMKIIEFQCYYVLQHYTLENNSVFQVSTLQQTVNNVLTKKSDDLFFTHYKKH